MLMHTPTVALRTKTVMLRHVFSVLAIIFSLSLHAQSFTWTRTTAPTTQNLWGICYEGKQFVAVGEGGTILTSIDGATWTLQKSGTSTWLTAVCYANGLYVAVGDNGTILSSVDGVYTAIVRGVGDTTGSALVEVYEMP